MSTPLQSVAEIRALPPDAPFAGVYLLRARETRTARNGNPFLKVELGDKTGSFNANCFADSAAFELFERLEPGAIVRLQGTAEQYQDRLSPRLGSVEAVPEDEAGDLLDRLVETPPEDPDALWADLERAVAAIGHDTLRETTQRVVDEHADAFRTCPAAIAMHHAYRSGLLEHTVHMARAAQALLPLYPEVDPDLALAGIILHDVGKIAEYGDGPTASKTRTGLLQGHVVLGYRAVRKAALQAGLNEDLTERLEHIILSHQGELEWGAAAMAATPEAVFVSMVDNLDAKMGMVQRALRVTPEGEEQSEFLRGLQAPVVTRPPDKSN